MNYQKYKYKRYDSKFPLLYEKEKVKLLKIVSKNAKIEHVGSTSIPGLGGKGIIDIAIFVPKKDVRKNLINLEKNNFEYKSKPGDDKRKFLYKIIKYLGKERRVHIHLTADKEFWNSFLAFRDYLRENKNIMDEYAKIKKMASKNSAENGEKYMAYKLNFLKDTVKKALKKN